MPYKITITEIYHGNHTFGKIPQLLLSVKEISHNHKELEKWPGSYSMCSYRLKLAQVKSPLVN